MDAGETRRRTRGRAWEITVDFIETVAFAAVAGAMASLLLAGLALLLAAQAEAGEAHIGDARSGTLVLRSGNGGGDIAASLQATDVRMKITGVVARVRVVERFANHSGGWQEGVCASPLPENAAVGTLAPRVGARTVKGVIPPREAAGQAYAQAGEAGRRAALAEGDRPNLFTTSVANVGPAETVEILVEYQQTLRYEAGGLPLRFPLAVTPRYIPGTPVASDGRTQRHRANAGPLWSAGLARAGWAVDTDAVPDAARTTPPRPALDAMREDVFDTMSIEIELDAGMPVGRLDSPSHAIVAERGGKGRYRIAPAAGAVPADRDCQLDWRPWAGALPCAARRWVQGLRASGGTEMAAALAAALDGLETHGRLWQAIFVTDGAVGNEDQLFATIQERLGASRLFTVGVGSAPNAHFMTHAAAPGGGAFTYIGRADEVAARLDQSIGTVQLRPERAGLSWRLAVALEGEGRDRGIAKLWARHKIDALMDAGRDGASAATVEAGVVEVAPIHGLVSRYTGLVAIDTTPARPGRDPLESTMLPVALPDGMVHDSVFGGLPQTATPGPTHLARAPAALLLTAAWPVRAYRAVR